ncbi:MAG: preprotein translocase subunit Sec61beta [Ruminococcaceae bacterium]|nr:preprotein translocase subunit Sec61beta [Oscillospiraceae bacterium]MBR2922228.1 hypothetical protein [Alphaproteobacteria bacterium]MBR3918974.1 hypothetical protein [Clostridia bacterium]
MKPSVIIIGSVVFGAVVWLLHKGEKRKNTLYHASAFALIALQSLYSTLVQESHIYYVVFRFLLIFGISVYYVFLYYKNKKRS